METEAWAALHAGTPEVAVRAGTGALVQTLYLLRHPDGKLSETAARLLRVCTAADIPARTERQFGARALKDTDGERRADATTISTLGKQPLLLHTADGDTSFALGDVAGRALWARNAQGTVNCFEYEACSDGGRLLAITEVPRAGPERQREKFLYAPADDRYRHCNLVGAVTDHHDNAGTLQTRSISLTGELMALDRRVLCTKASLPDWAGNSEDELEPEVLTVTANYDALGAQLSQTNAVGVCTRVAYDISGAVSDTWFDDWPILRSSERRADGALLSQTAGNGVVEAFEYSERAGKLMRHRTARPVDHGQGALLICDLHYAYDPAGNLLSLDDKSVEPTWYRNEVTNGLRRYGYDTLYRLVTATGRERSQEKRNPQCYGSAVGRTWQRYKEQYTYDDGNNLICIHHDGGAGTRTRNMVVSTCSNRALVQGDGIDPDSGFLSGGLQKQLAGGKQLTWLADNQLQEVQLVVRGVDGKNDVERYHYAAINTRIRKVRTANTISGVQTIVTTYAGGCEVRRRLLDGKPNPLKHVAITEVSGGRFIDDRLAGKGFLRYVFSDHQGSCGGETDQYGKVVAREEYAPYGGTTGLDDEAAEVTDLMQRTYRHAGKECDASGLYKYGWRYYQSDVGRWLCADPGGLIDGLNLYRFNRNSPMRFVDSDGRSPTDSLEASASTSTGNDIPLLAGLTVEKQNKKVYRVDTRTLGEIKHAGGFTPYAKGESVVSGLRGRGFSTAITPHAALIWGGAIAHDGAKVHLYELTLQNTAAISFDDQKDLAVQGMMNGDKSTEFMMRAEVFVTETVPNNNIRLLEVFDKRAFKKETALMEDGVATTFARTVEFFAELAESVDDEGPGYPEIGLLKKHCDKIDGFIAEYEKGLKGPEVPKRPPSTLRFL
ncbi:RHS repeat-associated core domain-containing protein [Pseudomonas sp. HS6-2]|uniref:RHS repeat-associated core domain-containing protein n=1 Tax=Pseudomonas sp. HS6-2 TaxID=3410986 RepID=UPI003BE19C1F